MATRSSGAARRNPGRRPAAPARPPARPAPVAAHTPLVHRRATQFEGADLGPRPSSRAALALLAVPVVLVLAGVALIATGALAAGVVLAAIGALLGLSSWLFGSPARAAARIGGTAVTIATEPRLMNLTEGLCVAGGLPLPEVRVLEDPAANAVLLGAHPEDAVLVVTSGLLDQLDRIELEGVLAHELSHLRRGDAVVAARAMHAAGLLAVVWASTGQLVRRLAGADREARADEAAAALTRYPPGLAAALEKLSRVATRPAGLDPVTARLSAPLWCAPLEEAATPRPLAGTLELPERVALLHEL